MLYNMCGVTGPCKVPFTNVVLLYLYNRPPCPAPLYTNLLMPQEPCPPFVREERINHDEDGEGCVDAGDDVNGGLGDELALLGAVVAAKANEGRGYAA